MKSNTKKKHPAKLEGEPIHLTGSFINRERIWCPLSELRPEDDVVFEDLLAFPRVVFDPKSLKKTVVAQSDLPDTDSVSSEEDGSLSSKD